MNAMNDDQQVHLALARAVAQRKIPDNTIKKLAAQLGTARTPIRRIDVCAYGICIDYFLTIDEIWKELPELLKVGEGRVRGIEIFPWGIINPDLFHVHIEHEFDAIPRV